MNVYRLNDLESEGNLKSRDQGSIPSEVNGTYRYNC